MSTTKFQGRHAEWSAPAVQLVAITPHDSTNITGGPVRAIYVGGAGNIAILAADDSAAVTLIAVPVGTVLPIATKRVNSTNTTATNLVGLR